jgi:hypothetical protein
MIFLFSEYYFFYITFALIVSGAVVTISCVPSVYVLSEQNSGTIFNAVQHGLLTTFGVFWLSIIAAKLFKLPIALPLLVLAVLVVVGVYRRIYNHAYWLQVMILSVLSVVLFITLGEVGSFISKWDGAAHQTMVTKMMADETLLLSDTHRLDEQLRDYQKQPYYPHLIHSVIASVASVLAWLGLSAQQCFLALSIALPFLSISALVVAANRYDENPSALHSFVLLLFALAVPATLFSQSHHGSFARAIASVVGIGMYAQFLGDFRKIAVIKKASIIVLVFAIHLQGALFCTILLIAEMIAFGYKKTPQFFSGFLCVAAIATMGVAIFLYGNSYYMGIVNHDALADLFGTWRAEVISSPSALVAYSANNLFGLPNKIHGAIKFSLMLIGGVYLWKNHPKVLATFLLFILGCFIYIFLLLYLPEGELIKLFASPFAGAVSRLYEGISIAVLLLAEIGLLKVLGYRVCNFKSSVLRIAIVACIVTPALLVQNGLVELAKKFDTLPRQELMIIQSNIQSSHSARALLISNDNRYMALDNGKTIRSYLSYFDCPLPYDNSPECSRRNKFASSVVDAANQQEILNVAERSILDFLMQDGYRHIYLISKQIDNTGSGAILYEYNNSKGNFIKLLDINDALNPVTGQSR